MRLVIAEPAARDLDDILAWIARDNPAAAEAVFRQIIAAAERLLDFPDIGRNGRVAGTREYALPRLPYLLVWRNEIDGITLIAVLHGARDLTRP